MEEEEDHSSTAIMDEEEEHLDYYKNKLLCIRNNESSEFYFGDDNDPGFEYDWTVEQWNDLFTELFTKNNTSVNSIVAGIQVCPMEALVSFANHVRTAKNIQYFTIRYQAPPQGNNLHEESSASAGQRGNSLYRESAAAATAIMIPNEDRSKIDNLLGAIRANPFIKDLTLCCLVNPQSIQDFLTGNASLESFTLRLLENRNQMDNNMARCIAAGLEGNKALKKIGLFVCKDHLDIVCAGLGHCNDDDTASSCFESLSLWTNHPENNPRLGPIVLEAIRRCPCLKELTVAEPDYQWTTTTRTSISEIAPSQPWVDHILKNLHHPNYAGLETLRLEHLTLGTSIQSDGDAEGTMRPDHWIVPREQANSTLKEFTLERVTFTHETTALLMYNLIGLTKLYVRDLSYLSDCLDDLDRSSISDFEDDDGEEMTGTTAEEGEGDEERQHDKSDGVDQEETYDYDNNEDVEININDYWARIIRQCTDLRKVLFDFELSRAHVESRSRMLESILKGTCGHTALEELLLLFHGVEIPRGRLRSLLPQILLNTACLRELQIGAVEPQKDLAVGLAGGLRGNKSIQTLNFWLPYRYAGRGANYIRILESLSENHTLQNLLDSSVSGWHDWIDGEPHPDDDNQAVCEALGHLFQVNNSLNEIWLPALDLRQGQMRGLLERLGHNTTLKTIDMSNCKTNAAGFTMLGQALVDNKTIPVEHIVLPCYSNEHDSAGSLSTDIQGFFQSLVRMRHVKTVDFHSAHSCWPRADDEDHENCLKLLLRAAKENKYIQSFGCSLFVMKKTKSCIKLMSSIDYYLKLNRFGRYGLDSRKLLRASLWPAILAPMTTNAKNTDVLFFFIREYFMRHSYPLRHQQQQRSTQQQPPSPKRARLVGVTAKNGS